MREHRISRMRCGITLSNLAMVSISRWETSYFRRTPSLAKDILYRRNYFCRANIGSWGCGGHLLLIAYGDLVSGEKGFQAMNDSLDCYGSGAILAKEHFSLNKAGAD